VYAGEFHQQGAKNMKQSIIIPPKVAAVIPYSQLLVTKQNLADFAEPIERLRRIISAIPKIGGTDGMNEHPVKLHYFCGTTDIFICEYDGKDNMFGFNILNGDDVVPPNGGAVNNIPIGKRPAGAYYEMAEFGYTSLSQIRRISMMNLDYYWEEQSIELARYKLYKHYFKKPESAG
jgi:hypothetical protein